MGKDEKTPAEYRVYEKNPITNEWIDRGWITSDRGQKGAIKKLSGDSEGEFFAVPKSSWHPLRIQRVETIRHVITENGDEAEPSTAEIEEITAE